MEILLVDCNLQTNASLYDCIKKTFPNAAIHNFTDPLLALKFGFNNPLDALIIQPQMRFPITESLMTTLRQKHPKIKVLFVLEKSMQSGDFKGNPDGVITLPLAPKKLRNLLS